MRCRGQLFPPPRNRVVFLCLCLLLQARESSSWKNWMGEKDEDWSTVPYEELNHQLDSRYGVDVSFPTQHHDFAMDNPFGHSKKEIYKDYIGGCKEYYWDALERCDAWERDRITRNLNQPRSSHNFTSLGFAKIRAPASIRNRLYQLFGTNHEIEERWRQANTFSNQWDLYTYSIDMNRAERLKKDVIQATWPVLEEWVGTPLAPAAAYGVRIFIRGSIVPPHVDLSPLIVSAVINVGQVMDEPWPFELIGHDGMAYNITMEPGDMVLYEGHSVIHGHPFPMKGKYYGNVYVHFEPIAAPYTQENERDSEKKSTKSLKDLYKGAMEKKRDTVKKKRPLPDYLDGTGEDSWFLQQYTYGKSQHQAPDELNEKLRQTAAHKAAAVGDLEKLQELAKQDPELLHKEDANHWRPIHEAARGGSTEVIKYLVENGADVNERTNEGKGATPLWWAHQFHGEDSEAVKLLRKLGGKSIEPEMK